VKVGSPLAEKAKPRQSNSFPLLPASQLVSSQHIQLDLV